MSTPAEVRRAAVALLARREHSARELRAKLVRKGAPAELVAEVVAALAAEGLQSDTRFTEVYVRSSIARGQGLVRIRAALREHGIGEPVMDEALGACAADWPEQLEQVRRKRFGAALPDDPKERARQARFLQYRGFSAEQIRRALNDRDSD
ncbi:MAG: regulatory protein RecX [Thiohalomonadaceae bacterium]